MAQPKEAGKLAAYLFECFKHFSVHVKHPNERVLLIVDEFPAIQADADADAAGINPGLSVDGHHRLGCPPGSQPDRLELHDSPFSGGVEVNL